MRSGALCIINQIVRKKRLMFWTSLYKPVENLYSGLLTQLHSNSPHAFANGQCPLQDLWLSNHISQCIYWQCCTFEEFPLPVWLDHFISTKSRAQTSITSAALFLSSCPSVDSIGHRLGNVVYTFSSNLLPFCISLSTFESGLADWLTIQPKWVSSVFLPLRSCGEELSDSGVQRGGFNPPGCFLSVGVTTRFEIPVN